jgi:transposase
MDTLVGNRLRDLRHPTSGAFAARTSGFVVRMLFDGHSRGGRPGLFGPWQSRHRALPVLRTVAPFSLPCGSWQLKRVTPRAGRSPTQRRRSKKDDDQAIGRSRGGLAAKIHALVDALGNPANLMLTAGQTHDLACAQDLIENADPEALIADKAYDADPLINSLTEREIAPVIPPNPTERPNTIAISHFTASATSSSASSTKFRTFEPLRPATTSSPEIFSQRSNWFRYHPSQLRTGPT